MFKTVRTNSKNTDFIKLVALLDQYLKTTDGDEHDFYNSFNAIDVIKHVVISYFEDLPIACGAFKPLNGHTIEIKRMYTQPDYRGKQAGLNTITELEHWAKQIGYQYAILETGIRQIEANQFYKKCGYDVISNYDQYQGMKNSICYKKKLN